jgi:integrase/recombinase XerC/integrase/recombinase XerD
LLKSVPPDGLATSWADATEFFLRRDLAPGTRRIYRLTLEAVGRHLECPILAEISSVSVARAMEMAYPSASPATWNRVVATVRSLAAYARRQGWMTAEVTGGLERRRVSEDRTRVMSRDELDRLFARRDVALRDRCLWRLLYETGARANEVLNLNVEDLDLDAKRAYAVRKGGNRDVLHFQTGSARLLPRIINGRTRGPLFLAQTAPAGVRAPAASDRDPTTGRARLSYRRAAENFSAAAPGRTLHHLRHSAITHLAEAGVPLPLLMAKSGHESLRTLQRYARPSVDAVAALTAAHDPAARRR